VLSRWTQSLERESEETWDVARERRKQPKKPKWKDLAGPRREQEVPDCDWTT